MVRKTLIILTPGFAKDEQDTTCLPMQQHLIKTMKELDPVLDIIILSFQYPYHKKPYQWFGVPVIPFNGRNKGGVARLLLRKKILGTLDRIHRDSPITGLLSFWYGECAAVGSLFAKRYGLKHFCWILGQDARKDNKYPRRVKLKSNELIALSDFVRDEFEKNHGIKPGQLITPGVETALFENKETYRDIDILGVGSLIPLKRYDIFIEATKKIKEKFPGVKAEVIGNGPEKDRLRSLISASGLQSNITLSGELPYYAVLQRMQRAKVLLHPSSYEGFSGACLEALYAGNQTISFCRAMNQEIEQWHIVHTTEEMGNKAISILENSATTYKKIEFCTVKQVASCLKALFE